jgi:hypothetical protein
MQGLLLLLQQAIQQKVHRPTRQLMKEWFP